MEWFDKLIGVLETLQGKGIQIFIIIIVTGAIGAGVIYSFVGEQTKGTMRKYIIGIVIAIIIVASAPYIAPWLYNALK